MSNPMYQGTDPNAGYNFDPSQYTSGSGSPTGGGLGSGLLSGGIGGLGAGLMGLFGHSEDPAKAAQQYYSKIPGTYQQYLNPYNQMGQQAGQNLQGQYSNLLNNPGGELNQIGQSYHQSPGFQFALNQAMQGANRASGAGGLAGSPSSQLQNMNTATQMGNQDYYNYLNQATNLYGQGLQGEQGMYAGGLGAAGNMANGIAQGYAQQGQNAYAGAANKNQNNNSIWGNIAGGAGDILAAFGI